MRFLATIAAALMSSSLPSCAAQDVEQDFTRGEDRADVAGIQSFTLGSKFEDIFPALDDGYFSPIALQVCYEELSLFGCAIGPLTTTQRPYYVSNGIPYKLTLEFNKFGVLVVVRSSYDVGGGISGPECLEITERVIDKVGSEYGSLTFQTPVLANPDSSFDLDAATIRETPAGNRYAVMFKEGEDGPGNSWFHLLPLFSAPSLGFQGGASENNFWDENRFVSVSGGYRLSEEHGIETGSPCSVGFSLNEPLSLGRYDVLGATRQMREGSR